jgi:alkylhydroperoxidase/carboxymuconolactone decarboxylase family protein YurZ
MVRGASCEDAYVVVFARWKLFGNCFSSSSISPGYRPLITVANGSFASGERCVRTMLSGYRFALAIAQIQANDSKYH